MVLQMSGVKRMAVFSIRKDPRSGASVWIRVGNAVVNRDSSVNVYLDALPIDGKLHLRDTNSPELDPAEVPNG